ncbi:Uu.00g037080.m01.CDS01 [Anthostomella pinea]|uniref:Uu.00g037080.m01.CDS01 n=1 Tax=Anthostomella pinea TaxID=933095 RepID=A0AAI8V9J1_9PEZI|nr:Uu.00g037080.m01.CDS01 [Anthostomella pinea]
MAIARFVKCANLFQANVLVFLAWFVAIDQLEEKADRFPFFRNQCQKTGTDRLALYLPVDANLALETVFVHLHLVQYFAEHRGPSLPVFGDASRPWKPVDRYAVGKLLGHLFIIELEHHLDDAEVIASLVDLDVIDPGGKSVDSRMNRSTQNASVETL